MVFERYGARLREKMEKTLKAYNDLIFITVGEVEDTVALRTKEHLRTVPEEGWAPIFKGCEWGSEYETLWVKGKARVPAEAVGKKLFAVAKTGAREAMLFVDGKPCGIFNGGSSGGDHYAGLIGTGEKEGQEFDVAVEGYAWHFVPGCSPFENYGKDKPDEGEFSRIYNGIELAVADKELLYFCGAFRNLLQAADVLPESNTLKSKAKNTIEEIFPHLIQYPINHDREVWHAGIVESNEILRRFYSSSPRCTNLGKVGIIGHSHMDTAWLWPVSETVRKCARTYCNALSLMNQYPEYKFIQSSALHSDWMRRYYPTIFEDMKKRVAEGRYEPNGGVWVECDCNITSGEFMIRQFLKGQLFSRKYFDFTPDCFWLPDTFGYNATIPQIMNGCDVKYFYTTKMSWNDMNEFPYTTFYWQGADGSRVLTHLNIGHCAPDVETVCGALNGRKNKDSCLSRYIAFGYGDGGGGPHFGMIEDARFSSALGEIPEVKYMTASEFMKDVEANCDNLPLYNGELYLELHRGTLTQMHDIKRNNRKAEFAVRNMEYFNVLSGEPLNERADEFVKILLKNQFHDILPGTSIEPVNIKARKDVSELIAALDAEAQKYEGELVSPADGALCAFNTLSFDRDDVLYFEDESGAVEGAKSQEITDLNGKNFLAVSGVTVPAFGAVNLKKAAATGEKSPFVYDGKSIDTPMLTAEFDEDGYISSLFDKTTGRQVKRDGAQSLNTLYLAEDVPNAWDDWDVDYDIALKFKPLHTLRSHEVAADGAVVFIIRSIYSVGEHSTLTQDMIFRADSAQIDFHTVMDWQEKHTFLKVGFDVDVLADFAKHEIQFGHIARPTTENNTLEAAKFEVCNYKWTDLSEGRFGVAVLNDCKYGISVNASDIRLSLHKSGCRPDTTGDRGVHEVTYSLLPHAGSLDTVGVIRPAYMLNIPAVTLRGEAKSTESFLEISADNVICEAVKPAEAVDSACVIRLYECERTKTSACVRLPKGVKSAYITNMLEDIREELTIEDGSVELTFRPFEIKTLMFKF